MNASRMQGSQYFLQLPTAYQQEHGVTEEIVHKVFIEFARAKSVYNDLTSDLQPNTEQIQQIMLEDSDYQKLVETDFKEFLTQLYLQQLFIGKDGEQDPQQTMETVYQKALEGVTFEELAATYPQSERMEIAYSKALIPEAFALDLVNLEEGEISKVLVDDAGASIFKVTEIEEPSIEQLRDFEANFRAYEEEIRNQAIEQLKSEHFDAVYEEWRRNTRVDVNREQWGKVDFDFE